ncbi:N-acetylmuramic acid 6-phosphate etherase [Rhodovastum atsumiense]|uniref:N-acetylmuramic acid 6-phosphate etherase n=1 Tax=Rhodovastum atsumiense TaxID=504468 RepID=UPI001EEF8929|nr:N-acetylmuramic acid 6-phosphate etherase [Rhodovastum atsumiense]CAH2599976.1 N-acetylmuramic acid 6-phosphate etherase [Rhodovastum atsumiense]
MQTPTTGRGDLPATETVSRRYQDLDRWPATDALLAMWEGQLSAVAAVQPALPAIAEAAEAALPRLAQGGRLVYAGAGTSGRIGVQDGAELPPTFDWPEDRLVLLMAGGTRAFTQAVENAEDDRDAARSDVAAHAISAQDVVIGIAASGSTPYTTTVIEAAAERGALTIGIANSPGGSLLAAAAHPILVSTGAEAIAGSTRMKAGTAQKVVLNLFSTLVMLRLGRVHRGLMVDMNARNAKLRTRAVRMLRELTGRDDTAIAAALEAAGGRVKTAILLLRGLDRAAADALLARHGGHLHAALTELAP